MQASWHLRVNFRFGFELSVKAEGKTISGHKRRLLGIAFTVVVMCALLALGFSCQPREPGYEGKKLSKWLRYEGPLGGPAVILWVGGDEVTSGRIWFTADSYPKYREVMSHVGTNAIPFLMRWVRCERSSWKDKAAAAYKKWPRGLKAAAVDGWLTYGRDERLADGVVGGFMALGSEAGPAVPDLIDTLRHTHNNRTAERVILCLGCIGPPAREALPYLRELAENPRFRISARVAIQTIENGDPRFTNVRSR